MLQEIQIRDLAIVERLTLEFGPGMNVLTGETGAGKSILLDALGLCLGDRAGSDIVRPGAEKAEVSTRFDLPDDNALRTWLEEQELLDDELLIRRVVQAGGRSRAFINGAAVPLQTLRELGERLVDIHGQHAHQSLLRAAEQRRVIDDYADAGEALRTVADTCDALHAINTEIQALEGVESGFEERLELLRYQVQELETHVPDADALNELEAEHQRLGHADDLIRTAHGILADLTERDDAAQSALGRALRELNERSHLDATLGEAAELFQGALTHLEEGCDALRRFTDHLEADPERLASLDQQLATLRDLARKHRVDMHELPDTLEAVRNERDRLDGAGERLSELRAQREKAHAAYLDAAQRLSGLRQEAARRLAEAVAGQLAELGMQGAELIPEVIFDPAARPARSGSDRIALQVRTNPGQPPGPLGKVASGGELSRLGLAVQVSTVQHSHSVPTLVFDEADAGIGGAVAEVVGRMLRTLGGRYQVLCVTHLPQVAAQAGTHFRVSKERDADSTRTRVVPLEHEDRVDELARMLGGVEISSHERAAAAEMLARGAD